MNLEDIHSNSLSFYTNSDLKDTSKHNYHQFCIRPLYKIMLCLNQHTQPKANIEGLQSTSFHLGDQESDSQTASFVGTSCPPSNAYQAGENTHLQYLPSRLEVWWSEHCPLFWTHLKRLGLYAGPHTFDYSLPLLEPLSVFCRASKKS